MSITIESLELEIQQKSSSAVSGIDALTLSLGKLKSATKGGVGLTAVVKQITNLKDATNGINASSINNVTGLAKAVQLLSGVKVSTTIGKSITEISNSISTLNIGNGATKIQELVTAIKPLSELPKQNLSQFITQIKKIPKVFKELNLMDMGKFKKTIQELADSLKPLATQIDTIAKGFGSLPTKLNKVMSSTSATTKGSGKSGSSALGFMSKLSKIGTIIYGIKRVGTFLKGVVDKSSNYIENVNLFTVAMGSYADEAKEYAEIVGSVMGIDPGEWMRNQGIFQTLATGFGVAGDKASIMSKNLTQLGYDISSFYNIDVNDAMQKLKSGFAGELEPLRAIGYDLSQAKLEAIALELGIDKTVSSMTQAEKSMLRYHAIMTQVTTVQGDMARTLDQPANQIRILKAQFEILARSIGNIFIPMVNKLLPYVIAATKLLNEMVSTIASLVGFEMPEIDTGVDSLASGSEDTATALEDASEQAKKLKSYMLGFDELNVISPNDSSSGDADIGSEFDFELPEYDFIGQATNERIDGIITKIKEVLKPLGELIDTTAEWLKGLDFKPLVDGLEKTASSVGDLISKTYEALGWVYNDILLPILGWAIDEALPKAFDSMATALETIDKFARPVLDGIKELKIILEPIITWVGEVVVTVLEGLGSIFSKLGDVFAEKGDKIKGIITGLGEVVSALWMLLQPIITNIIPLIKNLLSTIGDLVANVVGAIIDVLAGLIDFVAGVLTGDWTRAWDGIKGVFSGVWDLIVSIFAGAWNIIKDVVIAVWDSIIGIFEPVAQWFNDKVIQPVVNFFKGLWESIAGFFDDLWEDIKWVWNTVASWFDEHVIKPIVNFFAPIGETISQIFYGCWLVIQAVWVVVSTWFNDYVIKPTVEFFKGVWTSVSEFFKNLWDDIVAIWNTVANWFNDYVVVPVVGFFKGVWTSVSGFFVSLWEDVKGVWNKVSTWFNDTVIDPVKTAFEKCCDAIGGFFSNLWLGLRIGVATAMNGIITSVEWLLNKVIDGLQSLIGGFNKVVTWAAKVLGADWSGIPIPDNVEFGRIDVPKFAEGGFPESGQTFIARENGIPEMVGSIGRRTAVANNDQIVESVSAGVAEANSEQNSLLREQNSLLRALLEKDSGVYLDGRSLSESVDKYKREKGRVLIAGGVL